MVGFTVVFSMCAVAFTIVVAISYEVFVGKVFTIEDVAVTNLEVVLSNTGTSFFALSSTQLSSQRFMTPLLPVNHSLFHFPLMSIIKNLDYLISVPVQPQYRRRYYSSQLLSRFDRRTVVAVVFGGTFLEFFHRCFLRSMPLKILMKL